MPNKRIIIILWRRRADRRFRWWSQFFFFAFEQKQKEKQGESIEWQHATSMTATIWMCKRWSLLIICDSERLTIWNRRQPANVEVNLSLIEIELIEIVMKLSDDDRSPSLSFSFSVMLVSSIRSAPSLKFVKWRPIDRVTEIDFNRTMSMIVMMLHTLWPQHNRNHMLFRAATMTLLHKKKKMLPRKSYSNGGQGEKRETSENERRNVNGMGDLALLSWIWSWSTGVDKRLVLVFCSLQRLFWNGGKSVCRFGTNVTKSGLHEKNEICPSHFVLHFVSATGDRHSTTFFLLSLFWCFEEEEDGDGDGDDDDDHHLHPKWRSHLQRNTF